MKVHYQEQMPMYVVGQLDADERAALEKHLVGCPACQAELSFWRELAAGISASNASMPAPTDLAERAIKRIHAPSPLLQAFLSGFSLLRAQVYLVRVEMWPASAAVMALGVIVALLSRHISVITVIAPLMAAASLATIYGPQNDPANELTLSTPISPWKILLARMILVSGFDLLLTMSASLTLLAIVPAELLGTLVLAWLGPLTFLSTLALLLSMWIGTNNAITLSYGLWIAQYIWPPQILESMAIARIWEGFLTSYRQFWQSPILLFPLALVIVCLALLSTQRDGQSFSQRLA
jgi:hypothetical protein